MGSEDITESRIEAALRRLDIAAQAISNRPAQGSLIVGEDPVAKAELDRLRVENQLLRQELLELTEAHNSLKDKTDMVSGRLDDTIHNISAMLE